MQIRSIGKVLGTAVVVTALVLGSATPAGASPDDDRGPAPDPVPVEASPEASQRSATAPGGQPARPGVDQIVTSRFVKHLANVPSGFPEATGVGTDIAFQGRHAFVGNYDGFTVFDVLNPLRPRVVSQVLCPGAQNDVTVSGNLLVLSTDSSRSNDSCSSVAQPASNPASWEGVKIFDVANPAAPRYVKSVETDCGSHTHTLVPGKDGRTDFVYVSSYGPNDAFPDCRTPHDKVSVVAIPKAAPQNASVVAEPVLFPDGGNPGGDPTALPNVRTSETTGCHDITVFPSKDLAAGACMGDGILMDISDRAAPRVIERVRDETNFAFWHSATFNNAGTKVVFTDELGGGGAATCNAAVGPKRGANGIYDVTGSGDGRSLAFRSYYKIPRPQADTENCVAHNGSLIPVRGRDIMVQAWYQGGVSIWDFTDSSKPREIGFFERGPLSETQLIGGGSWSAYWYNGFVYSSDLVKGFDVLAVADPQIASAFGVRYRELNVQTQPVYGR